MPLVTGRHACIVTAPSNGWFKEAGKDNTPFIGIPLQITEGPNKGHCEIYNAWISDAAYERTVKNLKEVFGWDGDLEALAQEVNTGPFVNKRCSIVVEEEPDRSGNPRTVIKWLNGPDGGGKTIEVNRALQLARRLSGKPPGEEAPAGAPVERRAAAPRPPSDPNPMGIGEDDIPFNEEEQAPL